MANSGPVEPSIVLTSRDARRFLLWHQQLWPPRALSGKEGVLEYIQRVDCIQFDPINVVGRNPELVLQARVGDYQPSMLEELLYKDRLLLDGWDKMSSIHLARDWPCFSRHRARMVEQHWTPVNPAMQVAPEVKEAIRQRGPLSSNDLEHRTTLQWSWGQPTRLGRAALETLYAVGEVGVHHRFGTRRYFDLVERLLPPGLISAPDPNPSDEDYQNWHVLRRVGGLGLALANGGAEFWLAILGLKTQARKDTLSRLVERGDLLTASVEGLPRRIFFLRTADRPALDRLRTCEPHEPKAALLAPLDNLLWDRVLLRLVFGLDYAWEVYKPAHLRKYGYYVLPVLYGDRFVARFEPTFDKKTRELTVANWRWEEGIAPDEAMEGALVDCFHAFLRYLGAERALLGDAGRGQPSLRWLIGVKGG